MGKTQDSGKEAEDRAASLLLQRGLRLVQRNYRCRGGEIDLIMRDGECLVFIEVRYRSRSDFGDALASVDQRKRQRITLAAQHYLATSHWVGPCRFDVIGFDRNAREQWIRDAFGT